MIWQNAELYNVECLLKKEEGTFICRVPEDVLLHLSEGAQQVAARSSTGVEVRFVMNEGCERAVLKVKCHSQFVMMQLYYGEFQGGWTYLGCMGLHEGDNEVAIDRPGNMEQLKEKARQLGHTFSPEVMRLCFRSGVIADLQLEGDLRPPRQDEVRNKKILFYGSSITHGSLAHLPCGDYVTIVSSALGMDRINKGLAGNCLLEDQMADYLIGRDDYEFAVFELGSNIGDKLPPEEFERRVMHLLEGYTQAHPDKRAYVIDDLLIAQAKHEPLHEAARRCVEKVGNPLLTYINGHDMLPSEKYLSADFVHPTVEGHQVMADYLLKVIRETAGDMA